MPAGRTERPVRHKRGCEMSFLWFLIVGIIAGFLAGKVMRGTGFGLIGDLIVGVLGALLGGWVFGLLHISLGGGLIGSIIVAFIGAVILIWLVGLIRGRR